jgi:hypothetical protein
MDANTFEVPLGAALIGLSSLSIVAYTISLVAALPAPRRVKDHRSADDYYFPPLSRSFRPWRLLPASILVIITMSLQLVYGLTTHVADYLLTIGLLGVVTTQALLIAATLMRSKSHVILVVHLTRIAIFLTACGDLWWGIIFAQQGVFALAASMTFTALGLAAAAYFIDPTDTASGAESSPGTSDTKTDEPDLVIEQAA